MKNKHIFPFMGASFGLAGLILLAWIATSHAAVPETPTDIAPQVWEAVADGGEAETAPPPRIEPTKNQPFQPVTTEKVGRNAPCPCGSGKKYKKCCGR